MTVFYYTPQREVWTLQMSYRDIYKITKIVWALWLDKRSVWMRVCKHGRNVKMFCFLHVNHTSTNLKTFLSWKPDKPLYYSPIPSSAETWKKNPYFGKHLICKTRADYACKTSRLLRISLLISATTKSCIFSRESWFIKAIEIFFSCICIAWYKHLRGWENSRQLSKPSTSSQGLHNKHGKCLLLLK